MGTRKATPERALKIREKGLTVSGKKIRKPLFTSGSHSPRLRSLVEFLAG
jgi:hypothetical protein